MIGFCRFLTEPILLKKHFRNKQFGSGDPHVSGE